VSPDSGDEAGPSSRVSSDRVETEGLDLALMVFAHTEGAEPAYADAPAQVAGVRWAQEVAFVEHHRRDRIVVRGEFADAVFGPPGFAAGLAGGGLARSVAEERSGPQLRSAFFEEVRCDMPEGSSAVVLWPRQSTSTRWSPRSKDVAAVSCAAA
jgi:hypothetical protein